MATAAADAKAHIEAYLKAQHHFSIFPVGPRLIRSLGKAAEKYETSNKGTIRFPLEKPVPLSLVKRIAKARIGELRQRGT